MAGVPVESASVSDLLSNGEWKTFHVVTYRLPPVVESGFRRRGQGMAVVVPPETSKSDWSLSARYCCIERPSWCRLLDSVPVARAFSITPGIADMARPARIAMMVITTSNSMRVKPALFIGGETVGIFWGCASGTSILNRKNADYTSAEKTRNDE